MTKPTSKGLTPVNSNSLNLNIIVHSSVCYSLSSNTVNQLSWCSVLMHSRNTCRKQAEQMEQGDSEHVTGVSVVGGGEMND